MRRPSFPMPGTKAIALMGSPKAEQKAPMGGICAAGAKSKAVYFATKFAPTPLKMKLSLGESGPV